MLDTEYTMNSDFDVEEHKKKFVNYLEVMIKEDGTIEYAVPSHQEKAIAYACCKDCITRDQLLEECPSEFYGDFLTWLLRRTNTVAVWNDGCIYDSINSRQISKLKMLKINGVYKGRIPSLMTEKEANKTKEEE